MTLQLEIEGIAPPTIATRKGRMKCSSLRPGCWLDWHGSPVCVLINSAKLQRAVILIVGIVPPADEIPVTYEMLSEYYRYLGQGRKRFWWPFLPKFLRQHVCPYSKP